MPIILNAAGRASKDVITRIIALRSLVDIKGVFVIDHTGQPIKYSQPAIRSLLLKGGRNMARMEDCKDCGTTHLTDDQIRKEEKERTPDAVDEIDSIDRIWHLYRRELHRND